ncbi:MAG: hypothetical protein KatS3mg091_233 [Patescibacteria group bacterium]|nr:MAG: hypothetical protein KatS3mg091_233 [Patescibacteria group bacterium]
MKLKVFTDGGARGNPGPAAVGFLIYENSNNQDKLLVKASKYIGKSTNNKAEYTALLSALRWILDNLGKKSIFEIEFFLDSQLVCHQLNGLYKIKDKQLENLVAKIRFLEKQLNTNIRYTHIPRIQNKDADLLVNQALDSAES